MRGKINYAQALMAARVNVDKNGWLLNQQSDSASFTLRQVKIFIYIIYLISHIKGLGDISTLKACILRTFCIAPLTC